MLNPPNAGGVATEEGGPSEKPAESFLKQLEERLETGEEDAAAALASWLLSYQPGPLALARIGMREPYDGKQRAAA